MATDGDERWTILRLLQWTTDYFRKHGSESPRLEAEVLLAHVRQQPRIQLYTSFDHEPSPEQLTTFRRLVKQRAQGEPVAYLIGQREFYSIPLQVDRRVLIPRPETEHLVVAALDAARHLSAQRVARGLDPSPLRIVDVGTGSGAIAIAIATHLSAAELWACDRSADALEVARANVQRLGLDQRIRLIESDLLDAVPGEFDLIVSNPPYVRDEEYADLPREVRDFEPRVALVGGPRGTEVISQLIGAASHRLPAGGILVFEHSPQLSQACTELLAGWTDVRVIRDLAGHARLHWAERTAT